MNGPAFFNFVNMLHAKQKGPYFLFLDNCSIHLTNDVRQQAAKLKVPLVFNVPYSPWFNGIEHFWAQSKRIYKKIGTRTLLSGEKRDLFKEARLSVDAVDDAVAQRCARSGL